MLAYYYAPIMNACVLVKKKPSHKSLMSRILYDCSAVLELIKNFRNAAN